MATRAIAWPHLPREGDIAVSDPSNDPNASAQLELMIASRKAGEPFSETVQAVETALRSVPGGKIVRLDRGTHVVVSRVPQSAGDVVRQLLGEDFIVEANAPLNLQISDRPGDAPAIPPQ